MARKTRRKVIKVSLSKAKVNLSEFIKKAGKNEVVVTVHGRPVAVIIGFEDEDDWLDYQLLQDERFLGRVAESRRQYQRGDYKQLDALP
jgi:prevent-host-death family protein